MSKIAEPRAPSREALVALQRTVTLVRWPFWLWWRFRQLQFTWTGADAFPRKGRVLVVSNHTTLLDPAMIISACGRPIQFMATQSIMQDPNIARIGMYFGAVLKKKFAADIQAIRRLRAWSDLEAAVGVFPEGERSWDGELLPMRPGTERLVRIIDAPLVTVRIVNGERVWPRWAPVPRQGRVHIEFDAPLVVPKATDDAEIRRLVGERLAFRDRDHAHWPVRGRNLAMGVTNPLFACPGCRRIDVLRELGDHVECAQCRGIWQITTDNELIPERGPPRPLAQAFADCLAHLAEQRWVADPQHFAASRVVHASSAMRMVEVAGEHSQHAVAQGKLLLRPDRLEVVDETDHSQVRWSLSLDRIIATSVELRRRLQFRTYEHLFEADIPTGSVICWKALTDHWCTQSRSA